MKFGVISQYDFVLDGSYSVEWKSYSFALSRAPLSFLEIFDSAVSTPARYVQEIFVRLCASDLPGEVSAKFVYNPLFETNKLTTILVLDTLRQLNAQDSLTVLIDQNNTPVGYIFPSWLDVKDSRFISLLSTVNGEIDAELLRRVFFTEVTVVQVTHLNLNKSLHNNFWYESNLGIYLWIAKVAIAVLKLQVQVGDKLTAEHQRNNIPFTAVIPYHAGDVLFFSLAYKNSRSCFSRAVINKAYQDIVTDVVPALSVLPIDLPLVNRDEDFQCGKITYDHEYFERFRDDLPKDSFYAYLRPSREYNVTKFHLIDHFAFALGSRLCSRDDLLSVNKEAPTVFIPAVPVMPIRVLLHFDGGWPLKVYPKEQQQKLIDLLHAKGYEITVLARENDEFTKCAVTTFRNFKTFAELLKSKHILIGMDSFPAHYATHILGLPTICLFANTRPENSNSVSAANYVFLENGLHCRPCAGIAECPLYGNTYCKNFVSPEVVANEVNKLLQALKKTGPTRDNAFPIQVNTPCHPSHRTHFRSVKHISLRHIKLKIAIAALVPPYLSYISLLYREFIAAVRSEGILWASLRVVRFLRKAASGKSS